MIRDLFDSNFTIPNDTICICGSGSNAVDNYDKVKDDFFTIACNAAIGMPLKFDAWGIADYRVMDHEYFQVHSEKFQGIYLLGEELLENNLSIEGKDILTFNTDKGISSKDPYYKLEPNTIKMGGTVAGCMMQVAYWCGRQGANICDWKADSEKFEGCKMPSVKFWNVPLKIRLLGVQLTGKDYFDGTQSYKSYDTFHAVRKALNKMVKYMVDEMGCDIKSLNETFLDVETI